MKGNNNRRREFNFTDNELMKMMTELRVSHAVSVDQLKQAFFQQIKAHHSDKGGDVERAKNITQAYRVLKQHLEAGILLPAPRNGPSKPQPQQPSTSAPSRSGCRPNRQGQQAAPDGFEDFGDFQETKKRRRKKGQGGGDAENNQQENGGESSNGGEGTSNGTNGTTKSQHKFVNGYIYAKEDYSTYDDPMERPDRQKDGVRKIRGGLILYQDFQRSQNLPQEYQELGTTFTEDDLVDNPIFEPILAKIRDATDDLHAFAEKLRTFVYISWALDGGSPHDQRILIQRVKIHKVVVEDDSLYEITVPAKNFDEDVLTPGLHVEVTSDSDTRLWASAVIEQVRVDSQSIVVFFMDPLRISRILNLSNTVNVAINCSAFVYRSQLRSIEYVEKPKHTRDMSQVFFPKPEFTETFPEFAERRQHEVEAMPFREEADHNYNEEQKNAIYSIVQKANNPWPFILFGPPGTGKTITLIEAIRHLVMQSDQNRILVCTPSKMAADNFAEALLAHNFLDNKYIFRMHSLSTMAKKRNKKLDPISYLAKEAKYRFFGIPDRLNLKMFRVIISTLATSSYLISAGGLRGYFTHLIFDEAGQALESEIWITIGGLVGPQTSVCLAGDPMQLGPVLNVKTMKYFGFDNSMLKRIITSDPYREQQVDDRAYLILRQTYRSHPKILRPCSYLFYDNMLVVDDSHDDFHKYSEWTGLPTKGFPIIFHSSRGSRDEQSPNKSFHNDFEADLVARYVEQLLRETPTLEKDVGIISPYKNQVIRLRHRLAMHPGITVDSVEGFQGSERDVIIISTVRQLDMGFLRCDLRLNTSISRAKFLLIVFGNEHLLSQHTTWKKFIFYCQFHGGFLNESGEKMLPIAAEEVVQDREAEQYMQNIQNGSGARVDEEDDVATVRTESEYYEAEEEPPGEDNDSW